MCLNFRPFLCTGAVVLTSLTGRRLPLWLVRASDTASDTCLAVFLRFDFCAGFDTEGGLCNQTDVMVRYYRHFRSISGCKQITEGLNSLSKAVLYPLSIKAVFFMTLERHHRAWRGNSTWRANDALLKNPRHLFLITTQMFAPEFRHYRGDEILHINWVIH